MTDGTSTTPTGTLRLPGRASLTPRRAASAAPGRLHDIAAFIARTEPPTVAHIECIRRAMAASRHAVLLSGSAFQARSPRNPLLFRERAALVRGALTEEENSRLDIVPIPDSYNNEDWKARVRRTVRETAMSHGVAKGADICLVGHSKDESSYYLSMFPGWTSVNVENIDGISATPIREAYFADPVAGLASNAHLLPPNVVEFLRGFAESADYRWLVEEQEWYRRNRARFSALEVPGEIRASDFYKENKARFDGIRHLPPIVETNAVVVQSGHVLMVERLKRPGRGLIALPGDTLKRESFLDGILRVLVDDLRLLVTDTRKPEAARSLLEGKLQAEDLFDHPHRSERGQLVSRTHAFILKDDRKGLPSLGRGTKFQRPFWCAIEDIDPESVYEDGGHVIERMLSLCRKRGA